MTVPHPAKNCCQVTPPRPHHHHPMGRRGVAHLVCSSKQRAASTGTSSSPFVRLFDLPAVPYLQQEVRTSAGGVRTHIHTCRPRSLTAARIARSERSSSGSMFVPGSGLNFTTSRTLIPLRSGMCWWGGLRCRSKHGKFRPTLSGRHLRTAGTVMGPKVDPRLYDLHAPTLQCPQKPPAVPAPHGLLRLLSEQALSSSPFATIAHSLVPHPWLWSDHQLR